MQLKQFRVHQYRNIIDSGWIDITQITAFVGQNEAGKSNHFEALYRLHPFETDAAYNIDEDWPADDWGGRDPEFFVCEAKFTITDANDIAEMFTQGAKDLVSGEEQVEAEAPELPRTLGFTYKRRYNGKDFVQFNTTVPDHTDIKKAAAWVRANLPRFVYIAEYELSGTQIELNQLAQRHAQVGWKGLSHEEQTILIILQLAKIELDDFLQKGTRRKGAARSFIADPRACVKYTAQSKHPGSVTKFLVTIVLADQGIVLTLRGVSQGIVSQH